MIIEIYIVLLVVLKITGLVDISWTVTAVISSALIVVAIQLHLDKRSLTNGLLNGAKIIDSKLDDFEFRLSAKEDREN